MDTLNKSMLLNELMSLSEDLKESDPDASEWLTKLVKELDEEL